MTGRFDFLLGTWDLEYRVPKSRMSDSLTGSGKGTFRRALDDKYVIFEYSATFSDGNRGSAMGIFAEDPAKGILRYWWFEDSGSFMTASCRFEEDGTLAMNWHDSLLTQTFRKVDARTVVLEMRQPAPAGAFEMVMEVRMSRQAASRV